MHDSLRSATWPEITPLREKLYGDNAKLEEDSGFVKATGADV